ncbi:MAG TPA: hypothetical protein VH988_00300 [Thermoanaerobaculia bacterium]|jgi:hypothetical protein|nr:hypothetical protein [Thermoanaerobaculia bacterium]
MYVVALQFEKNAGDALAVRLAAVLGRTLLEARNRVSDPEGGPSVLATFPEKAAAEVYAEELKSRGFSVLVLPPEDVESDKERFVVRSFELGPEGLKAQARLGSVEVPWQDVRLLLRGQTRLEQKLTKTSVRREFSLQRAVLTHGLLVTKPVKETKHELRVEHNGFLHLYRATGMPLVFRQQELSYAGLGPRLQHAIAANFSLLVAALREASPRAAYDERLATAPGQARLLGSLPAASHLDVAISLVSQSLLSGPR